MTKVSTIYGHPKYRILLAELDEYGVNITIHRMAPKRYEVHRNFETIKCYRTRKAANRFITRQHKEVCNG